MGSELTAAITKESGTSFFYSFSFLPREQREAIHAVYAFCRHTDDIVDGDHEPNRKVALLRKWRLELEKALAGTSQHSILNQLSATAKHFHIPVDHFYELIRGVEMDLSKTRYETFEELAYYCYHVASSVGLICTGIFSPKNERSKEYAIELGIALQLTNILRDLKSDARRGRIYLPLEDLRRFGYSEEDLLNFRYTPEFVALMEFECQRAEKYFNRAQELLPSEDRRVMFAAKIMERIYYHTLQRIKRNGYNVFENSFRLPRFLQFLIATKYWIKLRVILIPRLTGFPL